MRALIIFLFLHSLIAFADTKIEFGGVLVAEPCTVTPDSLDQEVEFGNVSARTFINHNNSAWKNFTITLKDCDLSLSQSVAIRFDGESDESYPYLFSVEGDAQGIAIQIENDAGKIVEPGVTQDFLPLEMAQNVFSYRASIFGADFKKITEGGFSATVMFTVIYD